RRSTTGAMAALSALAGTAVERDFDRGSFQSPRELLEERWRLPGYHEQHARPRDLPGGDCSRLSGVCFLSRFAGVPDILSAPPGGEEQRGDLCATGALHAWAL